ncbi:DUF4159 domain-containing protein [Phycisphaerales bacterium AB-hyl4]|uniref:DUF4159 domain-containing protein n=1 Tax=Natronomicrosphaera hydrolytica TaxID=3242702 RepID=A0ABV4U337_9BACT
MSCRYRTTAGLVNLPSDLRSRLRLRAWAMLVVAMCVIGGVTDAVIAEPTVEGEVRVALLSYGDGQSAECFATGFLDLVAREAELPVQRTFDEVALASDELFDYPFVVFAGEGAFTLSDAERANLGSYIEQGGFVLASAACSNADWSASFQRVMVELFGDAPMQPIASEHAIYRTLYEIDRVEMRRAMPATVAPMLGRSINGTLRVAFSPVGLNDTDNAGGGCCCCGGNEIRNARLINANLLIYALTH